MTLLIFDCDGVLVDSERLAHAELASLMTALGRPMTTEQAVEIFAGQRLDDVLRTAEALLSKPISVDLAEEAGKRLLARFRRELKPVAGVRKAIEALPLPRCVASSSTHERLRLSLEVTGLADLFADRLFSADQVEHGKPAPDLFLLAARSFGAKPTDCIVIEDSPLGIAAARAADMKAIGFVGASHAGAQLGWQLADAGADIVIDKIFELPACVERLTAG
ncbi:MAG TPA: HAD family hydrolase [Pseudolabrys sp.]|nr:HAD family hydrolase [Pseudolabrys sp.]